MSVAPGPRPSASAFERVLERIDSAAPAIDPPSAAVDASIRACWTGAGRDGGPGFMAVAALYEESETLASSEAEPPSPKVPDAAARAADLRREIEAGHDVDALRRLRRRCALLAHPDRATRSEREQAEQLMAELNAAIDQAIRRRMGRPHKP